MFATLDPPAVYVYAMLDGADVFSVRNRKVYASRMMHVLLGGLWAEHSLGGNALYWAENLHDIYLSCSFLQGIREGLQHWTHLQSMLMRCLTVLMLFPCVIVGSMHHA